MSEKARRRVGDRRSPADIAADQRCEDYDLRLTLTAQGAWNVKIADVKLMLKDKPGSDVFYLPTATRWRMVAAWDESAVRPVVEGFFRTAPSDVLRSWWASPGWLRIRQRSMRPTTAVEFPWPETAS